MYQHSVTINHQNHQQIELKQFINPQDVLKALIQHPVGECQCNQSQQNSNDFSKKQQFQQQIKHIQQQISSIRQEAVNAENMEKFKHKLYEQLDYLKEERRHIQSQISEVETNNNNLHTNIVKVGGGFKEMNERLKRRIFEVRQYIQKMTYQNQRIEEGIITSSYHNINQQHFHQKQAVRVPLKQSYYPENKSSHYSNYEAMMNKLSQKQQQAWRRVRHQEEEIQRRNYQRKGRSGLNFYSPRGRTHVSPDRSFY